MESLQEVDGGHTDALYGAAVDFKPVPGCTGGRVESDIISEEFLSGN